MSYVMRNSSTYLMLLVIMPAAYAAIGQLSRPEDRGTTLGVTQSALQGAMAIGGDSLREVRSSYDASLALARALPLETPVATKPMEADQTEA